MRTRRLAWVVGVVALLATVVVPAAEAEDQVTVPTRPGQKVAVHWEGTAVPGANPGSECGDTGSDSHEVTIKVPPGVYEHLGVTAVAKAEYSGPNDVIVTVVRPDGKTVSGDDGFVDSDESTSFGNPASGTYVIRTCMFAGATPQAYKGTLELTAKALPIVLPPCHAPREGLTFSKPSYVDKARAGGEPSVRAHPNGKTLLYAAHAGTTHFFTPDAGGESTGAFYEHYRGQVYAWYSDHDGETWKYVEREPPLSGFSDPDFAIDAAGNTYLSEINLANVAVSKSEDAGHSYELKNFFAMTMTDRQWKEAGPADTVFMVGNADAGGTFPTDPVGNSGHLIYRSTDGGETFSEAVHDDGGLGDLAYDHTSDTLYEAHYDEGKLQIAAFRTPLVDDAEKALTPQLNTIATGVNMLSHWPAIDVDRAGNVYIVWDESGEGTRPGGVWYSYSRDGGRTWYSPERVDPDDRTEIWPWIAVGEPGRVAIAWFGNDHHLEDNNAELAGDGDPWNVYVAQTLTGLGCPWSHRVGFRVTKATPEPFHVGTVCMGGTVCQAELVDRRLGDYFTIDIDTKGALVAAYSDTRQGGAVALPAFFRQTGGPPFAG